MEQLIKSTAAYRIFCREAQAGRLAHAYMLSFSDAEYLRSALKIFAVKFFGAEEKVASQIMREVYPDCRVFPEADKKFNVEAASVLTEDSAMRPSAGDKKLYVISNFDECSSVVQNKLLKVIEEPLPGIAFILGVCSLSPVLPTIISRVRLLEIPPFTAEEVYGALERKNPGGQFNRQAAEACAGVFGTAERLAGGELEEVRSAAAEILAASDAGAAGEVSLKYGDSKLKRQILAECQRMMLSAARSAECGESTGGLAQIYRLPALIRGAELFGEAMRDLKFNAYFSALIYGVMLKVIEENDKWHKLSE